MEPSAHPQELQNRPQYTTAAYDSGLSLAISLNIYWQKPNHSGKEEET